MAKEYRFSDACIHVLNGLFGHIPDAIFFNLFPIQPIYRGTLEQALNKIYNKIKKLFR